MVIGVSNAAEVQWSLAPGSPGQLVAIDQGPGNSPTARYTPPPPGAAVPETVVTVSAKIGTVTKKISFSLHPEVEIAVLARSEYDVHYGDVPAISGARHMTMGPSGLLYVSGSAFVAVSPDGTISLINMSSYFGIALGGAGQVFAASYSSIYKLDSEGNRKIIFLGDEGTDDGPIGGATVGLGEIDGLLLDAGGNLVFTDTGRIRKLSVDGVFSTIAGHCDQPLWSKTGMLTCRQGIVLDGKGTAARFERPKGLAIDAAGTLFVADMTAVRKIALDGTVTTLAVSPSADFTGISLGAKGEIYLANYAANTVQKLDASGKLTTLAWAVAEREGPRDVIAVDAHTLLVLTPNAVYRLTLP